MDVDDNGKHIIVEWMLSEDRDTNPFPGNPISIFCKDCKHYSGKKRCLAFPEGIPEPIWWGEIDHDGPIEGDHGYLFDPKNPEDYQ